MIKDNKHIIIIILINKNIMIMNNIKMIKSNHIPQNINQNLVKNKIN